MNTQKSAGEPDPRDTLVRAHFEKLAGTYDKATSDWVRRPEMLHAMARFVSCGPLLDLACGTGVVGAYFKALYPRWIIRGVDISPKMCRIARRRGVAAVTGRAEALPFRRASFSTIVCRQGLHYFDPGQCLVECRRVLRPEGRVVFAQIGSIGPTETQWWTDFKGLLQPLRRIWLSQAGVARLMQASGFEIISRSTVTLTSRQSLDSLFANVPQYVRPADRAKLLRHWTRTSPKTVHFRHDADQVSYARRWLIWAARPHAT